MGYGGGLYSCIITGGWRRLFLQYIGRKLEAFIIIDQHRVLCLCFLMGHGIDLYSCSIIYQGGGVYLCIIMDQHLAFCLCFIMDRGIYICITMGQIRGRYLRFILGISGVYSCIMKGWIEAYMYAI
jgi:hypothetical protein